ncbi:hypothetical protein MRX96_016243 [Rhipicephalus microplus]
MSPGPNRVRNVHRHANAGHDPLADKPGGAQVVRWRWPEGIRHSWEAVERNRPRKKRGGNNGRKESAGASPATGSRDKGEQERETEDAREGPIL